MLRYVCIALWLTHDYCNGEGSVRFSEVRKLSGLAYSEGHNIQFPLPNNVTETTSTSRPLFRWDVNQTLHNETSLQKPKQKIARENRKKNRNKRKKKKNEDNPLQPLPTSIEDKKPNTLKSEAENKGGKENKRKGKNKKRKGERRRRKNGKNRKRNRKMKDHNQNGTIVFEPDSHQKFHKHRSITSESSTILEHERSPEVLMFFEKPSKETKALRDEQAKDVENTERPKSERVSTSKSKNKYYAQTGTESYSNNFFLTHNNTENFAFDPNDNEIKKFYHLIPSWKNSIFRISQRNFSSDENECLKNNGGCEGLCINTPGSYHCHCPPGFRLDASRKKCRDINECILRNGHGPCQGECENRWGGYRCGCLTIPGTELSEDGKSCRAVDSCSKAGCSHLCQNTRSGAFCFCPPGLVLASDWKTCEDVDECLQIELQDIKCQGNCINTVGSYTCL